MLTMGELSSRMRNDVAKKDIILGGAMTHGVDYFDWLV